MSINKQRMENWYKFQTDNIPDKEIGKMNHVPLSDGEISNILAALDIMRDDLHDQLSDPEQANVHVLCELKLKELASLREKLAEELLPL